MADKAKLAKLLQQCLEKDEQFTLIVCTPDKGAYALDICSDMDPNFVSMLLMIMSNMMDKQAKGNYNGSNIPTKH